MSRVICVIGNNYEQVEDELNIRTYITRCLLHSARIFLFTSKQHRVLNSCIMHLRMYRG